MSNLVNNLKLPLAILGTIMIVWHIGASSSLPDDGYSPTASPYEQRPDPSTLPRGNPLREHHHNRLNLYAAISHQRRF